MTSCVDIECDTMWHPNAVSPLSNVERVAQRAQGCGHRWGAGCGGEIARSKVPDVYTREQFRPLNSPILHKGIQPTIP
jgi:hypothetical protein